MDVRLLDSQNFLDAKARALSQENHRAVGLRDQRQKQKELLYGKNHRTFATLADALDFDEFHRVSLPLDHLPQHGLLIQAMYDGFDVTFGLVCSFEVP